MPIQPYKPWWKEEYFPRPTFDEALAIRKEQNLSKVQSRKGATNQEILTALREADQQWKAMYGQTEKQKLGSSIYGRSWEILRKNLYKQKQQSNAIINQPDGVSDGLPQG